MTRRIGTGVAALVLAGAVVAGTGAGLAGQAMTGSTPEARSSRPSPRGDGLLGAGNVLATTDFAAIGWAGVRVESIANGESQFAYACQRTTLAAAGRPGSTVSVDWVRGGSFTAAETVAQLEIPPQARELYARLSRWYRTCTAGGRPQDSTMVASVSARGGVGQVWRIGAAAPEHAAYGVVARAGERVGLVDVYGDVTAVDPAGLRALATSAVERLR